uniref:Uncharacterized protein n=1 Tax=Arion vulgaris TaxID=1028688 RepID=A0A0B6ZR00_9EUPU
MPRIPWTAKRITVDVLKDVNTHKKLIINIRRRVLMKDMVTTSKIYEGKIDGDCERKYSG